MKKEQSFPEKAQTQEEIFRRLDEMIKDDLKIDGRAFAFIYDAGAEVREVARRAFAEYMGVNGLDPTVYPSARRIENEIVAAALEQLRAPEGAVGTATAGGTESVLLAVKTARDYARKTRPEITEPEMLLPVTGHACFHKASHYYGVKIVPVAVDPTTMRASVSDLESKLTPNTILIVGSAPSYAHGVVDPIEEMGRLAEARGILFHVDACIGGWVLPFLRENGVPSPSFDFTVPGVTSISADLHKYAFAPKGVSVLLHRTRAVRDAQFYACATWTGYSVINTTTLGSKSVAAMAAGWAVLNALGKTGFRELAEKMWNATTTFVSGVRRIPGLRVVGEPAMGLVAVTTEGDRDLFELSDRMLAKGWHLQPTYAFGPSPAHIHFTIDPSNSGTVPRLLEDLEAAAEDLPQTIEAPPPVVQLLEMIGQGSGDGLDTGMMMKELGIVDGQLPPQQAMIHRLINAASPTAREALLIRFMGELFS